jgi:hypothetical protein
VGPQQYCMKLSHRTQLYHFGFGRDSAADYIQSPVIIIVLLGVNRL